MSDDEQVAWDAAAAQALGGLLAARCPEALANHEDAASDAAGYADAIIEERRKRYSS